MTEKLITETSKNHTYPAGVCEDNLSELMKLGDSYKLYRRIPLQQGYLDERVGNQEFCVAHRVHLAARDFFTNNGESPSVDTIYDTLIANSEIQGAAHRFINSINQKHDLQQIITIDDLEFLAYQTEDKTYSFKFLYKDSNSRETFCRDISGLLDKANKGRFFADEKIQKIGITNLPILNSYAEQLLRHARAEYDLCNPPRKDAGMETDSMLQHKSVEKPVPTPVHNDDGTSSSNDSDAESTPIKGSHKPINSSRFGIEMEFDLPARAENKAHVPAAASKLGQPSDKTQLHNINTNNYNNGGHAGTNGLNTPGNTLNPIPSTHLHPTGDPSSSGRGKKQPKLKHNGHNPDGLDGGYTTDTDTSNSGDGAASSSRKAKRQPSASSSTLSSTPTQPSSTSSSTGDDGKGLNSTSDRHPSKTKHPHKHGSNGPTSTAGFGAGFSGSNPSNLGSTTPANNHIPSQLGQNPQYPGTSPSQNNMNGNFNPIGSGRLATSANSSGSNTAPNQGTGFNPINPNNNNNRTSETPNNNPNRFGNIPSKATDKAHPLSKSDHPAMYNYDFFGGGVQPIPAAASSNSTPSTAAIPAGNPFATSQQNPNSLIYGLGNPNNMPHDIIAHGFVLGHDNVLNPFGNHDLSKLSADLGIKLQDPTGLHPTKAPNVVPNPNNHQDLLTPLRAPVKPQVVFQNGFMDGFQNGFMDTSTPMPSSSSSRPAATLANATSQVLNSRLVTQETSIPMMASRVSTTLPASTVPNDIVQTLVRRSYGSSNAQSNGNYAGFHVRFPNSANVSTIFVPTTATMFDPSTGGIRIDLSKLNLGNMHIYHPGKGSQSSTLPVRLIGSGNDTNNHDDEPIFFLGADALAGMFGDDQTRKRRSNNDDILLEFGIQDGEQYNLNSINPNNNEFSFLDPSSSNQRSHSPETIHRAPTRIATLPATDLTNNNNSVPVISTRTMPTFQAAKPNSKPVYPTTTYYAPAAYVVQQTAYIPETNRHACGTWQVNEVNGQAQVEISTNHDIQSTRFRPIVTSKIVYGAPYQQQRN